MRSMHTATCASCKNLFVLPHDLSPTGLFYPSRGSRRDRTTPSTQACRNIRTPLLHLIQVSELLSYITQDRNIAVAHSHLMQLVLNLY